MPPRLIKTTEYLRHTFTQDERLKMGDELAGAHNRLASIGDEETVVKAKFKERISTVEQTINALSRDLSNGWTMQNVECALSYGEPNPLEVTYRRADTGDVVKVRPMEPDEMQEELPLEESARNVAEFFPAGPNATETEALAGDKNPPKDEPQTKSKKRKSAA